MHLAAGLSVGLAGVAAGYTIGIVGDAVCLFFYLAPNVCSFCIHCCAWFLTGLFFFAGCACLHAAIASLRRNDTHFDFRRSSRSLRVSFYLPRWGRVHLLTEKQSDRRVDSELEELKSLSFGYVFDIIHYQGCQLVADPSLRLL